MSLWRRIEIIGGDDGIWYRTRRGDERLFVVFVLSRSGMPRGGHFVFPPDECQTSLGRVEGARYQMSGEVFAGEHDECEF